MKYIMAFIMGITSTLVYSQAPQMIAPSGSLPTTVWTSTGTYIVVPNYSTGQPQAVVQVNRNSGSSSTTSTKSVDSGSKRK